MHAIANLFTFHFAKKFQIQFRINRVITKTNLFEFEVSNCKFSQIRLLVLQDTVSAHTRGAVGNLLRQSIYLGFRCIKCKCINVYTYTPTNVVIIGIKCRCFVGLSAIFVCSCSQT